MGSMGFSETIVIIVGGLLTLLFWAAVLVAIWKIILIDRNVKMILVVLEEIRSRQRTP